MLRTFQPGFRKGKNCLKQIHTLKRLLQAYRQHQLPLLATFEDFSKAFDSFDRKALFEILSHYGIPCKITDAITAMYTNSSSRVRLGNHLSKAFYITTGVLQGDVLVQFLFIILVDYILRQTDESHGLKTHAENPEENLPESDFSGDIVLLDEAGITAAEHYANLQNSAKNQNQGKTKIMHINYHREGAPSKALEDLAVVEDFKYLGARLALSLSDFL